MSIQVLELHPGEDYVELYKVLKIQGWVGAGGEAKMLIADGQVRVNQDVETRKRRKLVAGDNVTFAGESLQIGASTQPAQARIKPIKVPKPKGRPAIKF